MQFELADPGMISARVFDDEIVVANFATGTYYSLRFAGVEVWLGLMAGMPLDRVVEAITPQSAMSSSAFAIATSTLVRQLEDEQLIRRVTRPIDERWQPRAADELFEAPVLERFTDMEDLLLLDPIHDVGKTGWPDMLRKNPA